MGYITLRLSLIALAAFLSSSLVKSAFTMPLVPRETLQLQVLKQKEGEPDGIGCNDLRVSDTLLHDARIHADIS